MNRRECLTALAGASTVALGWNETAAAEGAVPTAKAPMIAGPDPDPKKPAYVAPAGAVDTHTHIFGPVSAYPYVENRSYTPPEAPLASFRALHERIGVKRAVIVNATVHGTDNRVITDAIAQSNGAYLGIGNVDDTMSEDQLAALNKAGLRGCRFIYISRLGAAPDMTAFDKVVDKIKGLGWHVDLYLQASALDAFAPRLRKLPVPYVLDHMGAINAGDGLEAPGFKALVELLRTDEKCWVKITGPERASATGAPFHDVVPFARKLIETAPDRVLWGTDWPHPNVKVMPNDGDLVDLIPLFAPDPVHQKKLLVENPERLFKFDRQG